MKTNLLWVGCLAICTAFAGIGCDNDGDDGDEGGGSDAGQTLSIVGGTCASDADCVAGFTCADLELGGHCEKDCTADADCGPYGICTSDQGGVGGTCYRACATSSDCRSDRRCTGGLAPRLFCDPPSEAGGQCQADSDCAASFMCADLEVGGHCEKDCTADADCGEGGICTSDTGGVGGTCYHGCTTTADCRPDRRCVGGVAPRLFCDPPSAAGGQCMADTDCADTFMCADLEVGGHCEKDCAADADCGEGGICTSDMGGVGGTCYHACTMDSDCRPGRVCVGGVAPRLFCDPPP